MITNKKNRNIGAAIFFILFSLLFFVLMIRFITIQYTGEAEGKELAVKAAELYLREGVLKAQRGTIYDQNGQVIAEDTDSYTLVAVLDEKLTNNKDQPRHVVDPKETATQLAKLIDMSEDEIYGQLTKDRKQVEFGAAGKDLPLNVKQKIEDLELPGITFIKDTKRFYPNGIFASHLIGYAQKPDQDEKNKQPVIEGKMGLEQSYNDLLTGKDGSIQYEGDIWNYILPNSEKHVKEPENGQDIYLTLDKKIQTFLEDAMTKVDEQYKPENIMAIVADPKTGRILAMGQRPTFHPATREGIDQSWHNEIIETTFEPGSTMKIFSLAAAVDKGVFNPNASFPSGRYRVDSKTEIKDHNGVGWGPITYAEGVQRSSNVGFAYLLEKMGTETWREYMDKFKFGMKTGIALPNEVPGKILYNYPSEKVTSVYGQGTTVTAMQMIQAMTAIANDGVMMKPYVVDKIVNPNDGTVKETKPAVAGNPISKETAREVIDILETVITGEHGTGERYKIDGYRVAGKTGTAQISDPKGGYLEGHSNYIFSFLGLAPAEDPQLVMYVMVQQPKLNIAENENGSVPVSMIYNTVMKNSLQYLNIEPEKIPEAKSINLSDYKTVKSEVAMKDLKEKKIVPVLIGTEGNVVAQLPASETPIIEGEKVFLRTEGKIVLPDLTGWSKREVLNYAELAGLKVDIVGQGYVYKQSVKPKTTIQAGEQLTVNFETPKESLKKLKQSKENDEPLD